MLSCYLQIDRYTLLDFLEPIDRKSKVSAAARMHVLTHFGVFPLRLVDAVSIKEVGDRESGEWSENRDRDFVRS